MGMKKCMITVHRRLYACIIHVSCKAWKECMINYSAYKTLCMSQARILQGHGKNAWLIAVHTRHYICVYHANINFIISSSGSVEYWSLYWPPLNCNCPACIFIFFSIHGLYVSLPEKTSCTLSCYYYNCVFWINYYYFIIIMRSKIINIIFFFCSDCFRWWHIISFDKV